MQRLTITERADALAGLGLALGLGYKYSLKPGSGILFSFLAGCAAVWFFIRMARVINRKEVRGLPKLWGMSLMLGAAFNALSILYNTMGWPGSDNMSAIGLATGLAYIAWLRLPDRPQNDAPNRVIAYIAPFVLVVSAALWLTPADARYRALNPASPYVKWEDYRHGYHLAEGFLVDSSGARLRPVEYMK